MKSFHDIVMNTHIVNKEKLDNMVVYWKTFNEDLTRMSRSEVLELLHYLLEHRPGANRMIERALGRFNAVNRATLEDLYGKGREKSGSGAGSDDRNGIQRDVSEVRDTGEDWGSGQDLFTAGLFSLLRGVQGAGSETEIVAGEGGTEI